MDSISEARLQLVNPILSKKIHLLATMLQDENIVFRVTQGLRTWNEQDKLYQQGRTLPGKIVTNAPAGHSWHEYGLAVDLVVMIDDNTIPDWTITHPSWQRLINVGESLGMYSGSEFCSIKDYPHFQLSGSFPVSPNDEARQIFLNAGMEAVWHEAGLVEPDAQTPTATNVT